ncbi:MAG: putative ABC transporter permease [Spirochaetaceae bacterium]|jgi:uncharacterized membrane protein|nr:putative ABC transporter permease [Spirochaetaceae bacterium]
MTGIMFPALGFAVFVFELFFLGFTGWALESVQETIVRKRPVNKGFFKGPFALSHAIGGAGVYVIGNVFKAYPFAVFLAGAVVCTAVEYIMAVFLEKCFRVKCWDYATYPHTKWCHFQGRICLTISIFFGLITLAVVYFYWDFIAGLALLFGNYLWLVDGVFVLGFFVDAVFTCAKLLRAKKAGITVKGWAVFSSTTGAE